MRVFKATYKDRNGTKQQSEKWYVEFRDHLERVKRLPAFTDKAQSEAFGRKVERLVDCRANNEPTDPELSRWIETLSRATREAMARIGLLEASRAAAVKRLAEHLDDFKAAILARGNTAKHVQMVHQRARDLFDGCGFKQWSDVQSSAVLNWLAKLTAGGQVSKATKGKSKRRIPGRSIQSRNFYLQAAKQFCRWMVNEKRATSNPLESLARLNVATDRRHERRALSVDELRRLLAAALSGPERFGMTGAERSLVYRLAVESGLRASELRSLSRLSFRFGAKLATVTVEAGSSKRRRRDELPLRPDTALELKTHLSRKLPTAQAFDVPPSDSTADMIRFDLAAARAAWLAEAATADERGERERSTFLAERDDAGQVVDFHGLRHTFITLLARSGVHPSVMQAMARHSDPRLTLGRYTHVETAEQAEALDLLPDLSAPEAMGALATGTDGGAIAPGTSRGEAKGADSVLAVCLAFSDAKQCAEVQSDAPQGAEVVTDQKRNKPRRKAGFPAIAEAQMQVHPSGLEPLTFGSVDRCSIQLS